MLLDTGVLVDIDRGVTGATEKAVRLDGMGRHAVSAVTVTELEYGALRCSGRRGATTDTLLAQVDVAPIDRRVACAAAHLMRDLERHGKALHDLHDLYIAATGQVLAVPVLTPNVRHFDRVPGIDVLDWATF